MKTFEAVVKELITGLRDGSIVLDKDADPKVGRPRSTQRCPCQAMTAYRAAKRGHVCTKENAQ